MVMMAARNSRKFIVALPLSVSGMINCHAEPCMVRPPIPHVQASEYVVEDGFARHILLILTPVLVRWFSINCHSSRSALSQAANLMVR